MTMVCIRDHVFLTTFQQHSVFVCINCLIQYWLAVLGDGSLDKEFEVKDQGQSLESAAIM